MTDKQDAVVQSMLVFDQPAANSVENQEKLDRHYRAAAHHEAAARHHYEAARNQLEGNDEGAFHNTLAAEGHHFLAGENL
jgi:hypothetical protein